MKDTIKRYLRLYFNCWWLPALLFLVLLVGFAVTAITHWKPLAIINDLFFFAAALVFLGIAFSSIWNLIKKRWGTGIVNALVLFACGGATLIVFGFLITSIMFGPSEDGFADNLKIPADVEIFEPGKKLNPQRETERDDFQVALLAALQAPEGKDATISGNISVLSELQDLHPAILRRYLTSSPAWRVFKERGNMFATRRWMIGSEWRYNLHGYYTQRGIDRWSESGIPDFQSRFTIGLSGKPWWRGNSDTTWLNEGETVTATLSTGNQMQESHCVISGGAVIAEVFEQSVAPERRLAKATLNFLQAELQPLAENPSRETARKILPPGSIIRGGSSFEIRNSSQPGIYDSMVWLNPGEPGMVYLKAFEVTKGTPLSIDRLKGQSSEWIGWSDDPTELFFSNTHFTIYEGDWGKPYAARLEIWFTPDSGKNDRKLIEKVFKIEGWQR